MSKQLRSVVDKYVLLGGSREELCVKAGISYSSLSHALAPKAKRSLRPQTVVQLALACGLTEKEALALAGEGASGKRRSA